MAANPHVVAVVVETDAAARLPELAARLPVWVADTPANRDTTEALRVAAQQGGAPVDITLFRVDTESLPDEWVVRVLGPLMEHHGASAHDRPIGELELYGVLVMDPLRSALSEHGFDVVTSDGDAVRAQAATVA
ncbi:MAG TPA: hypothetical protein VEZ47_13180 [Gemmatirosa sp.]|nr:hypothetical protein [Gemmatirosa sp.]